MKPTDYDRRLETLFSRACAAASPARLRRDLWPRVAAGLRPPRPEARRVPAWAAACVLLAALGAAGGTEEGRQLLGRLRGLFFSEVRLRLGDSAMSARAIRLDAHGETAVAFGDAEFVFRVTPYEKDKVRIDVAVYRMLPDGSRRAVARAVMKNRMGRRIRVDLRGQTGVPEFVADLVPRRDGGGYDGTIAPAPSEGGER
ncbi:MAG: hypothetical protein HY928_05830 [Elusimicrobia bacterium]|nr:hypothetical protein [Elusimicrobiota bacterium]